jgi:hypothetical protein
MRVVHQRVFQLDVAIGNSHSMAVVKSEDKLLEEPSRVGLLCNSYRSVRGRASVTVRSSRDRLLLQMERETVCEKHRERGE